MDRIEQTRLVKKLAAAVGFDRCGIAPAGPVPRADYVRQWLAAGRAGSMAYLHRNVEKRLDPSKLLPGAQSVIMVALSYHQQEPPRPSDEPRGRVAMYAWGDDYHKVVKNKLHALTDGLHEQIDNDFDTKFCVDTVPLLERELASLAGIGWIGKNTLVLNEKDGSYFFLGGVVTTLELAFDEPALDHCGRCTACLDACPADAFPEPYEMDASRCISYLTIEHRGDIDPKLHEAMGDWVFGCDVCQQVCPHNREAPTTREPRFAMREPWPYPRLSDMLKWSDADYGGAVSGSAIKRATHEMLQRNARIASDDAHGGI